MIAIRKLTVKASTKVRFLKSAIGIKGLAIRASRQISAPTAASPMRRLAIVTGEVQAKSIATLVRAASTPDTPIVSSPMPARSSERCGGRANRGRTGPRRIRATAASGTLAQKSQRQPTVSVTTPPISGPTMLPIPKTAMLREIQRPRCRGGNRSATVVDTRKMSGPPPKPLRIRPATKIVMFPARAHSSDPDTNKARPPR
jgi:hypothetical protein